MRAEGAKLAGKAVQSGDLIQIENEVGEIDRSDLRWVGGRPSPRRPATAGRWE
jgi:hypothetical protein